MSAVDPLETREVPAHLVPAMPRPAQPYLPALIASPRHRRRLLTARQTENVKFWSALLAVALPFLYLIGLLSAWENTPVTL